MKLRLVVGCIPVMAKDRNTILFVTSRSEAGRWILPKGGVEAGESCEEAGLRETWEEAGAKGTIKRLVYSFSDAKSERYYYEMEVEKMFDEWPEMHKRERKWVQL